MAEHEVDVFAVGLAHIVIARRSQVVDVENISIAPDDRHLYRALVGLDLVGWKRCGCRHDAILWPFLWRAMCERRARLALGASVERIELWPRLVFLRSNLGHGFGPWLRLFVEHRGHSAFVHDGSRTPGAHGHRDWRTRGYRHRPGDDVEVQPLVADLHLVPGLQLPLVDLLAIDERARRRTEVDDEHLSRCSHLDYRMHAADLLVIEANVARLQTTDLDDLLAQRFGAQQRVPVIDRKRDRRIVARLSHPDPPLQIFHRFQHLGNKMLSNLNQGRSAPPPTHD